MGNHGTVVCGGLTSSVWSLSELRSRVSSAANLGGIFIALDVTALAQPFAQIIYMTDTGPWETDWMVISSEKAMGRASLFTFSRALKTFTRYEVVTLFRL